MSETNTTDALREMARHVAAQLVADALKTLGLPPDMVGTPVTVTIHASTPAPRLALPAAKRRGRKPGPKPGRRKKPGPSSSGRTRVSKTRNAGSSPAGPAIERRCRGCKRICPVTVIAGRTVQCSVCGYGWKARGLTSASVEEALAEEAHRCSRCDHLRDEHDPTTGKCLSIRCVCTEFWP